ncbi:MAG: hypothetical protein HY537_16485 [Deltaproteobacteria bacterium]|nr:hypothetical protein [Deltaproteobacteria bacterium]
MPTQPSRCLYKDSFDEIHVMACDGCLKCAYHSQKHPRLSIQHHKATIPYLLKELTPDGICIHAFHSVYPFCLSLLYFGNRLRQQTVVCCPSKSPCIRMEINLVPHPKRWVRFLNLLRRVALALGIANDLKQYQVKVKVTGAELECPWNHKVDDVFFFNLGDKAEICPASAYSFYPLLLKDSDSEFSVQCPSHSVSVQYKVTKEKNDGHASTVSQAEY